MDWTAIALSLRLAEQLTALLRRQMGLRGPRLMHHRQGLFLQAATLLLMRWKLRRTSKLQQDLKGKLQLLQVRCPLALWT